MDITANKQDKIYRPDSVYTLNAGEMNQIISEIMTAITSAGIAPSSADTGQLREAILARISAHNLSPESHADIRQALESLQLLKLVDVLPAQGESKYLYAVPQDERTTDGQLIVVLFIWTGTEFAAVGALTTSVDLSEYLKKTEAQNTYLPKTGGYIVGSLSIAKENGVIDTLMPESGSGSGYTRLRVYSYDGNWVGYLLHNKVGDASIMLVDGGHLNISASNNKEVRIRGERILTIGDKGVSGGVASLGADGKVPQEQLPSVVAPATPVVDLGQVTSASFEVNKNYAASVSGGASITLPTPTDTTIANKITVNLTVLVASNIDWGVNANAALAEFTPGKYEIRLLWNNNSSAWTAEVLKETAASSAVKLLVRFNGNMTDESASPLTLTPSRTVTAFPVYAEGQYGAQKLTCTGDSPDNYVLASGINLPKLDLGTGDFTIRCWLTLSSNYVYPVRIFYKDNNNQIALGHNRIHIRIGGNLLLNQGFSGVNAGDTAYITLTRQNGVLYFFVNGTLVTSQASAEAWNLSDWTQIFKGSGVAGTGHYGIQELIVKNTCDYIASFTVPTAPFVLADSGVSDLHDDKKADRDLNNTPANIDYVVKTGSSAAGWYRLYKSGWIEQGGVSAESIITLPKEMADTSYMVWATQNRTAGPSHTEGSPSGGAISTTQIFASGGADTQSVNWFVQGMSKTD